jgi:hypothetical protein
MLPGDGGEVHGKPGQLRGFYIFSLRGLQEDKGTAGQGKPAHKASKTSPQQT